MLKKGRELLVNTQMENIKVSERKNIMKITTHDVAVFSICIYIIFSIVFEFTAVSLTALSSYALYLCLGCCLFDCLCRKTIRYHAFFGALLVLGMLIWISCFYTPASQIYTDSRMYRYWTSLVLMFLIMNVKPNSQDIVKIVNSFVIAGAALSTYVYAFYGFDTLANSDSRLQNGDFGNVNIVGMYCAFSIILAIYAIVALKKNQVMCVVASIICLPCVMFSGSRKALLTLIICLLAFVFLYFRNTSLIVKVLTAFVVLAVIMILVDKISAFEPIKERLMGLFEIFGEGEATVEGDENRILFLTEGYAAFLQKPIFGHGFCYSYHIFGAYSHNNYVELLMCHGVVGFLIYYSVFVALIIKCHRSTVDLRTKVLVYLVIIKMLVEDVGTVSYYNRMTFLVIALLTCFCMDNKRYLSQKDSISIGETR